ncbi:MAG: hypothetical protein HYX27_02685 [Acidobacteria bacterium]|nr:hypothetical protein [Acidobacteriota bacterium]
MNCKSVLLLMASLCGLPAQTLQTGMVANVPFAFDFQGVTLAAGTYKVCRGSVPSVLVLRNEDTGRSVRALVMSSDDKPGGTNALVFEKAGGTYYFRSVVDHAAGRGLNVPRTRKQVESAKLQPVEKLYIAAR